MKTLESILKFFNVDEVLGLNLDINNVEITNLCLDSRKCQAGNLFIAQAGHINSGVDFVDGAFLNGAVVAFVDSAIEGSSKANQENIFYINNLTGKLPEFSAWFYDNPSDGFSIIGVTGTNGKSSVCHFYAQLQTLLEAPVGVLGTIGNGVWPKVKPSYLTTLDCITLQQELQEMVGCVDSVCIESSSHGLIQNRVSAVYITIAVWTNLSPEHLDYHENIESYYQAKKILFLKSSVKTAIINIHDAYGQRLWQELETERSELSLISYSIFDEKADFKFENIQPIENGYRAEYIFNGVKQSVLLPVWGRFNCENILAVCAMTYVINKTHDFLGKLSDLVGVKGRMESVQSTSLAQNVLIDFAHTSDALEKALLSLKESVKGQAWCVFGCGGERDKFKRPQMAEIAERLADHVIVTEDNSRNESFETIQQDICRGFKSGKAIVIGDRKEAIRYALQQAQSNDMILIAGKGHEQYQDKNGQKKPFNEREIIEAFERDILC
tara:strand:- start:10 stop:1500 length:1491 start_codon:yes stop_codon:yes gene_type:complete